MNKEDIKLVKSVLGGKYKTYYDKIKMVLRVRTYEISGERNIDDDARSIRDLVRLLADNDIYIGYSVERRKYQGFINVTSVCIGSAAHLINGGLPKQD